MYVAVSWQKGKLFAPVTFYVLIFTSFISTRICIASRVLHVYVDVCILYPFVFLLQLFV